jgi:hypothetical protein
LLHIYNSLILSYLNYGIIVWGWQSDRLFKIQKKAIRILTKSKYNAHTNPLFRKLNLLKIKDICALHDFKICYKFHHKLLPQYFVSIISNDDSIHDYHTRNRNIFRLPAVRHEFARHSISYRLPLSFNTMNHNFKSKIFTHSLDGFKFYIKRHFIESYSPICTISPCYICGH